MEETGFTPVSLLGPSLSWQRGNGVWGCMSPLCYLPPQAGNKGSGHGDLRFLSAPGWFSKPIYPLNWQGMNPAREVQESSLPPLLSQQDSQQQSATKGIRHGVREFLLPSPTTQSTTRELDGEMQQFSPPTQSDNKRTGWPQQQCRRGA